MTEQTKAQRLADELDKHAPHRTEREAAAELRRLDALNAELVEAVEYIANCCQLSLDDPKFRIDEIACNLIRAALAKAKEQT